MILPLINSLFNRPGAGDRQTTFAWRLVHRQGPPFLLLPEKSGNGLRGLELYSAHRPLARLWRRAVPLVSRTPLSILMPRVTVQAAADSDFIRFLADQAGVSGQPLHTPAIKFGGVIGGASRLVLLIFDAAGNPIRIVKLGLNPQGRAATEREADLLSQLPTGVIGCTGITGRFSSDTLSAFATAYFAGKSLDNDVGIEKLFHAWLNDGPRELIKNLVPWQELELATTGTDRPQWQLLRDALADRPVRTALHHGDFAPWNVRMTSLDNIRAFDWERGQLNGIPAWDWFHFIVQTSILVKRHSPERVAAEIRQLLDSPRFERYAAETGISEIKVPLLLAYLLHQHLVVRPLEGRDLTRRLFQLLWTQWRSPLRAPQAEPAVPVPEPVSPWRQIRFACVQLANLFWEPTLSPAQPISFSSALRQHWLALIAAFAWIGGFAILHLFAFPHLLFTPFYLAPSILLALKTDRRIAFLAAAWGGIAGPACQLFKLPHDIPPDVLCWNGYMRVLTFFLIVILLDHLRKHSDREALRSASADPGAIHAILGNWAVALVTGIFFVLVLVLDGLTNPDFIFLPLYLIPCIVITLALGTRLGTFVALLASVAGPLLQRFDDPTYENWGVEFWNTLVRFTVYEMVVVLLAHIRRENLLFEPPKESSFDTQRWQMAAASQSGKKHLP